MIDWWDLNDADTARWMLAGTLDREFGRNNHDVYFMKFSGHGSNSKRLARSETDDRLPAGSFYYKSKPVCDVYLSKKGILLWHEDEDEVIPLDEIPDENDFDFFKNTGVIEKILKKYPTEAWESKRRFGLRLTETLLRQIIRRALSEGLRGTLNEHLHGYKGKDLEKYMVRELPPEASQLPHFQEWKEELDQMKADIEENYRKMTMLSIDNPKMYKLEPVDEDAMDYKHYHQMNAAEKYHFCKNELMYQKEDLIRFWKDLDEELGITDGFAGY